MAELIRGGALKPHRTLFRALVFSVVCHIALIILPGTPEVARQQDSPPSEGHDILLTLLPQTRAKLDSPDFLPEPQQPAQKQEAPAKTRTEPRMSGEVAPKAVEKLKTSLLKILFLDSELDTQPYPLTKLDLELPELEKTTFTGRMVLQLVVSRDGIVVWSNVEHSDFDEASTRQFAEKFTATRFAPGQIAEQAVDALIKVEIERSSD